MTWKSKKVIGSALVATAMTALLISSAVSQHSDSTAVASPEAVGHAESLSSAFRGAAHRVLPTVVKIRSEIKARRVTGRGLPPGMEQFRGTPFEEFFGEGFGDQIERRREGTGSGVIISRDGLILTNNHVVEDADVVTVELPDGREFRAEDIRTDPQTDIAIVRISGADDLPVATLGDSDALDIGDWVLAVGNPFELEASVSAGIISAKGRSIGAARRTSFLQTDAAINPGNSGGPLVDLRGEVVGINTAIASSSGGYQGIGFAIPVNLAKWVVEQLVDRGEVQRAWLGVGIEEMTQSTAVALGLDPRTKGVLVSLVNQDTPAERAGIQGGDVITHFDGRAISTPSELQRAVERAPLNTNQKVRVLREGREVELTVRTEPLPTNIAGESRATEPRDDGEIRNDELGLQLAELTPELTERLKLPLDTKGVVVAGVDPSGAAALSGFRRGMLLVEVAGKPIKTVDDFESAVKEADLSRGVRVIAKLPGIGSQFLVLKQR